MTQETSEKTNLKTLKFTYCLQINTMLCVSVVRGFSGNVLECMNRVWQDVLTSVI